MVEDQLTIYKKIRSDPWEFAARAVFTQDQKDRANPIKRFPAHLDYLKLYFRVWQKKRLVAVPKSRRMFLSWATLILYLHDTMFNIGRQTAVVSKKEDDADDLLERMAFILKNIPEDVIPKDLIPKWEKTYCCIDFPEIGSRILGFPSGSDQLRSYAASGILADECAFWPDAEEMYAATFPIIEEDGKMTMISSAAPGFFKKLVHDELDGEIDDGKRPEKKFPMDGIEIWENPTNRFAVFQIHYTADPRKRDGQYRSTMRSGMPLSKFNQEYEISWETYEGKVVFPDWNKAVHGSKERLWPHTGLPIICGVDFGLTPACVFGQVQENKLVIFDELVTVNMGAERFTELIKMHIANNYPNWNNTKKSVIMFIDPAGLQRSQSDETTCAQKLAKYFNPMPGSLTFEDRRGAVENFLCKMTKGEPNFKVDLSTCRILTGGFDGGYHFSESSFSIEPNKARPVKNEYSHIHDALQYLCSGINGRRKDRSIHIPEPGYLFEKYGGINGNTKEV